MPRKKKPEQQTVLVTGASSGFGHGVVKALLKKKGRFIVYAAARRLEPMQDLAEEGAHLLSMDVSDAGSVAAGVEQILAETDRIDIVFNNAGYGAYGAVETVSDAEAHRQFEVNLFGVAHVLRAVLPTMRKANSGRIINTSSAIAHMSIPIMGWYAASKFALKGLSDALRLELAHTNIHVVMIEPGAVRTGFGEVALAGMDSLEHPQTYKPVVADVNRVMGKMFERASDPRSTVKAMLRAATARRPKPAYKTTLDSVLFTRLVKILPTRMMDWALLMQARM